MRISRIAIHSKKIIKVGSGNSTGVTQLLKYITSFTHSNIVYFFYRIFDNNKITWIQLIFHETDY